MSQFRERTSRVGALSVIAVGLAIGFSSFAVVRAEHANPDKNKVSCNKSTPCIEGTNTGAGLASRALVGEREPLVGERESLALLQQATEASFKTAPILSRR
jgi:hypothetical protein